MSNPQIERYVKENIDKYPISAIKEQLLKVGYNEIEINEVLDSFNRAKLIGEPSNFNYKKWVFIGIIFLVIIALLIAGFFFYSNLNDEGTKGGFIEDNSSETYEEVDSLTNVTVLDTGLCGDNFCNITEIKNNTCSEDCGLVV
jgi:hypothetical protein